MNQQQREYLSKCNCMIQVGDNWLPAQKEGDSFLTPNGLKIVEPSIWRAAKHVDIVREMDESGTVPVSNFGGANG